MRLKWRRATWARAILGLAGLAFGYVGYVYLTLPDVRPLATRPPSTTAFMELRKQEARAEGHSLPIRQQWVPYGRISPQLKRAVLVAEDECVLAARRARLRADPGSIELNSRSAAQFVRGGQHDHPAAGEEPLPVAVAQSLRKLRELIITRRLEAELSKRRILELYLNVIEWGDGIFGCEAAAAHYFGKSAASLSADEAALLAGAIINPRVLNPAHPDRAAAAAPAADPAPDGGCDATGVESSALSQRQSFH